MASKSSRISRLDILITAFSIVILIGAIWVWTAAASISREIVLLFTTVALIIALVLVVNVAVLILLRLQRRITDLESVLNTDQPEDSPAQVVVVTLTNTERRIINRLEENGGSLPQDELRRITGMSKSTLSVALTSLERKSLVRREAFGKTKIVTLQSSVRR